MALDDQARDPEERGSAFSRGETSSMVSFGSSSSEGDSSMADGEDEDKGGHVNLVMNDLLNQPPPSSVNITNSSDVRVGPSLHYNGPVTINQFLNLQQHGAAGLENIPLPLTDGIGKGVISGVASSGVGACAEGAKRTGGGDAGARRALWWRRPKVLVAAGAFVVFVAGVVTMMALLWPGSRGSDGRYATASQLRNPGLAETDPPPNPELLLEDGRQIIRRSKWSDVPPDSKRELHHPTPLVVVGHTAGPACRGELACFPLLCTYRDEHRLSWAQPDISYNFLIDVEGNIYEGRGWDATNNYESWARRCNLGVSFLGNFMKDNVTQAMATSLERLLQLGVKLKKLDSEYRLVAHNQVAATLSPGLHVLNMIKGWRHRCLNDCGNGVQCNRENTTQVSTTSLSSNETGES